MTGESVLTHTHITPGFSTLFAKLGAAIRRMVSGLFAAPQNPAIPRPFPFFGE
jgi:hypothetical protein